MEIKEDKKSLKISELIKILERVKEKEGDIGVKVREDELLWDWEEKADVLTSVWYYILHYDILCDKKGKKFLALWNSIYK